jgi:peroxiredoxin (alkyl hydroperoxide reductase subunit C)
VFLEKETRLGTILMVISAFKPQDRERDTFVNAPRTRAEKPTWRPQIHESFPDFTSQTTKGPLSFSRWSHGHWVILLSHPAAFTPVCTSEIAAVAARSSDFAERGTKLLALTGSSLDHLQDWSSEIEERHDVEINFPHVSDSCGIIAKACGLLKHEPLLGGEYCARRTFIIDPHGTIRMIFDYPVAVGRAVDEMLRVLDALILTDKLGALTPSDWRIGESMMMIDGTTRRDISAATAHSPTKLGAYFRTDFKMSPRSKINDMKPNCRASIMEVLAC